MHALHPLPVERLLLVHNSPRVKRYFDRLARGLAGRAEVLRCGVGAGVRLSGPPSGTIDEIIDYGMRRKRARPGYGALRLGAYRRLYRAAARLHYDRITARIERDRPHAVGVWGGNAVDARAVVLAARHAGIPCFRFENGFLPNTTQMDARGVNVESSAPRDPEFYRWWADSAGPPAHATRPVPIDHGPLPLSERYVFVPFQVALDSQVLLHSPWVRNMRHFFEIVAEAAESAEGGPVKLVFKDHPRCPTRYPDLYQAAARRGALFANGLSASDLIRGALGVVTINSTVGAEGLLQGKSVLALGNAVYEVPGVASSARSVDDVAKWLGAVWGGDPPAAPLRDPFLRYLSEEHLIPDRHQDPGGAHFRAVAEKLSQPGVPEPVLARAEA